MRLLPEEKYFEKAVFKSYAYRFGYFSALYILTKVSFPSLRKFTLLNFEQGADLGRSRLVLSRFIGTFYSTGYLKVHEESKKKVLSRFNAGFTNQDNFTSSHMTDEVEVEDGEVSGGRKHEHPQLGAQPSEGEHLHVSYTHSHPRRPV